MPSFERAVEIGVDVVETDIHWTRDGHIVVSHDPDGQRSAGVGRAIAHCSLDELRTWDVGWGYVSPDGRRPFAGRALAVPTLEQVLDAFPEIPFNVDVKPDRPDLVGDLIELLARRGDDRRVTLASFHTRVMAAIRRRGFAGKTALTQPEVLALLSLPVALCRRVVKGDVAQIPLSVGPLELARRSFIDKCHRLGVLVDYWTVNDPVVADVLLDRGADGLITDDPALIRPVVERYR